MERLRNYTVSKYLRIIKRSQDFAIYHALYGGLCIVDKPIFDLIKYLESGQNKEILNVKAFPTNYIDSFLEIFTEKYFILPNTQEEKNDILKIQSGIDNRTDDGNLIGVVQLVVTNNCNFKCKYCFINSIYSSKERELLQKDPANQVMKPDMAIVYVKKVIDLVKKNGRDSISIQFFGGEPLMNWKAVKAVLDHFKDGKQHGINIIYSIVTNGSLISGEIAEYFEKYKVSVVISFDSPHGSDRPLAHGGNSKDKVEKSLNILNQFKNTIVFNSVLSKETYDYFDTAIVDFAINNKVREIGVLLDLDPSFFPEYGYENIVTKLMKVYSYGKEKGVVVTGYWHTTFLLMCNFNTINQKNYKTCSATGCQLSIEPAGHIFACKGSSAYFGHVDDLNSLFKSANYKRYASRSMINSDMCLSCDIHSFCSGICLGTIEKKFGNIKRIETAACDFYRLIVEKLVHSLTRDDIAYFDSPKEMAEVSLIK